MTIGEQIKTLRKQFKMSASKLGDLIGLSQQQISAIETGSSNITVDKLEKICEVFNIRPSYFWDASPSPIPDDLRQLLDHARDLTPEQLEQLTKFIKTIK